MALAYYASKATSGNWPLTIDLTTLSLQADDLVIAFGGGIAPSSDTSGTIAPTTSGYTADAHLGYNYTGTTWLTFASFYKKMGSTPDTNLVMDGNHTDSYARAEVYVLRGQDTASPIDATTTTQHTATRIDSPSITPVTTGALVITAGIITVSNAQTAPSGYGNQITQGIAFQICVASKAWSGSGAEDPGVWSGSGSSPKSVGFTLAIKPNSGVVISSSPGNVPVIGVASGVLPMWVAPSDVKSGVVYGPTGTEFTGTYAGGGGGSGGNKIKGGVWN